MFKSETVVDRPVFIFGTGRSGTTIFLQILGRHPDVGWISNYIEKFPRVPQIAGLSRILDFELIARIEGKSKRFLPRPAEPVSTLSVATEGVFNFPRVVSPEDLTASTAVRVRRLVQTILRWQGKTRFINKHTGFARTRYLQAIFPNALFIHVLRDGRAVVNSLLSQPWWDGTLKSWWWGPMRQEYQEEYQRSDCCPVVLAAIVWKTLLDSIEQETRGLDGRHLMTVSYSDFTRDYRKSMMDVVDFCGLYDHEIYARRVDNFKIKSTDNRWQSELTIDHQRIVNRSLSTHLEKYGFDC